ncbi:DUF6876 family protein [Maribacter polysaccharolyticus]|uniref:DUF6876 family protein n=1 Tax=Maribacter polysaccharolyticus TaxID=3020831 RepID=UPI00237F2361|nr:DUF6876 family protein [Maribacter polysaccharolyticus]MDE3744055.1 hypothetical protein [Maribacter polysaccharolyticus]
MENTAKETEIRNELAHNIGSEHLYHHPLFKGIHYTEGIIAMYETCNANWLLIDVLANCKLLSHHPFITIKLHKSPTENSCRVVFEDGNNNILQTIPYSCTDFPLNDQVIKRDGEPDKKAPALTMYFTNSVLLLPSEY